MMSSNEVMSICIPVIGTEESEVTKLSSYSWKRFHVIAGLILFLFFSMLSMAQAERVHRIAVVSFQSLTAKEGSSVLCPLCGVSLSGGKIMEGADKIVEDVFVDKLSEFYEIEIIPSEKVQNACKKVTSGKIQESSLDNVKKIGKELKADYLAVGYVYRFVERVGYGYSSEHPASVAFEIHLVKVDDASSIWRGFFDKTQKSLTENILEISSFFKGGAKWLTARQLTEQGMEEVFETLPDL